MKVKDFINGYNEQKTDKLKSDYVLKHIKVNYMPYVDKVVKCKQIVENNCYIENPLIKDEKMFFMDSNKMDFAFTMMLVGYYTDIDVFGGNGVVEAYDELAKEGILDHIIDMINPSETATLNEILDNCIADIGVNEADTSATMRKFMGVVSLMLAGFQEGLGEKMAEIVEKISKE